MKSLDVFIFASPLQLINCIEAKKHLGSGYSSAVLIKSGGERKYSMMRELLVRYPVFDEIIEFQLPQNIFQKFVFAYQANCFVNKNFSGVCPERVFVGEYRSYHINHIVNKLNSKACVLTDDGMSTLSFQHYRENISVGRRVESFAYRVLMLSVSEIDYDFFTMYKSISSVVKGKVYLNNLSFIKSDFCNKKIDDVVWFVGQPLVELGVVNKDYFELYLQKIVKNFSAVPFVYLLHPCNNENYIRELGERMGFATERFESTFEIEVCCSETVPKYISSFYSTALVTASNLSGNSTVLCYKIDKGVINQAALEVLDIDKYYKEFSGLGIEVVDLK